MLKSWATAAARYRAALPADCLLCGGGSPALVCPACTAGLVPAPHPFLPPGGGLDGAVAAYDYRFPLDRLVQRFKSGRDFAAGRWLADRLAERVAGEPRPDRLVAPPTPRSRLVARGLNPALHLARQVGRRHGLRVDASTVVRVVDTPPQRGLERASRQANVRGAFRCRARLDGLHVAIVEDVVTTGATAEELARTLRAAGAARVTLWAVSRTPSPGEP